MTHLEFDGTVFAPILVHSMAHHCGVRVDMETDMLESLGKEWKKTGLMLEVGGSHRLVLNKINT